MNYRSRSTGTITLILTIAMLVSASYASIAAGSESPIPGGFNNWSPVGPEGGDVRAVAIDPRDKNRIYTSTLDGHIHTSADGGFTWTLLANLNQPELILDQLMVDLNDSNRIYTSGHRHKAPGGFFKSTDGGRTWIESKELRNEPIHAMNQSTADPNVLFVGTIHGLWISNDRGSKWTKMESSTMPINVNSIAIDHRNTSTIYAGTWWRPYKSTDSGKTWRLIKNGMIDDSDVFSMNVDPRNNEHLIASACSGIYESFNGGEKWSKLPGIPSSSRRTRQIMQHPTQPSTYLAATTEGFWMSTNGGRTWALTTQRLLEVNSIAVHPDEPNRIIIGTNNFGVMVSNDGGRSFEQRNAGFTSRLTYFAQPDTHQAGRVYAATHNTATGGGGFFISNDNGKNWQQARGLDPVRTRAFSLRQDAITPNTIYLGTNDGLFRSLDRGMSWAKVAYAAPPKAPARRTAPAKRPATRTPVRRTAAAAPAAQPAPAVAATAPKLGPLTGTIKVLDNLPGVNGGLIAGTENGVFRAVDPLKGWEKLAFGPGLDENVYAIHIADERPDTIWAGTSRSGVVVSRDGGKTWSKTAGAVDNIPVSSIATDPRRPDHIYVGTTQTLYVSRDNGATWIRRGGNLPLGNYTSILINPNNSDEVIVSSALGSDGGIFISSDAGNRWTRMDTKDLRLASRRFWTISFDPRDPNRIFAGTHSGGVYRIERPATAIVTGEGDRPRVVAEAN